MSFGADFIAPYLSEPAKRPPRIQTSPPSAAAAAATSTQTVDVTPAEALATKSGVVRSVSGTPTPTASKIPLTLPLDVRKVVQRRALLELVAFKTARGAIVNLGIGMPAGIGAVADEEGVSGFTLTVEAGPLGGTPADGPAFGASSYPDTVWDQATMVRRET